MSDLPGFPNYFNLAGKVALVTGGELISSSLYISTSILTAQDPAVSACI